MAIEAGAHAIGLVGPMPSGPGVISDEDIASIAAFANPLVNTFLLTSEQTAKGIITHYNKVNTTTIQLVDKVDLDTLKALRDQLPNVEMVQVIHVQDEADIEMASQIAPLVDAILLDSGNPSAKVKTLGGTGKTHDWSISKRIVKAVNVPVYLAGGLNVNNVERAIQEVNPYGLDLCSGLRTNGYLDAEKLHAFFARV